MVGCTFVSAKLSMDFPRPVYFPTTYSKSALLTKDTTKPPPPPRLWLHKWRPVMFCLTVDDFGIKYVGEHHAQHILTTLQEHYTVTTDWEGKKYTGIAIGWN